MLLTASVQVSKSTPNFRNLLGGPPELIGGQYLHIDGSLH